MIELFNAPTTVAVAVKSQNKELQLKSTSGGMFSILANYIFENNGVVYGAAYNEDFSAVLHTRAIDEKGLAKLRNSKYCQSCLGDVFKAVKDDLESGKKVLFTGTSCQVAGLKCYLNKEYENLILVDVLCHGVPSPKVWKYYADSIRKEKGNFVSIIHKGKNEGGWSWRDQFMHIHFLDGTELKENIWVNSYMLGFLKDMYLRPACHQCSFKNNDLKRVADLTIADYWGCEEIEQEFFDGNGVSLVLLNSDKGKTLVNELQDCYVKVTDLARAGWHNQALFHSYPIPFARRVFFKKFRENMSLVDFEKLITYCIDKEKNSIYFKIKRRIIRVIGGSI